MFLLKATAQLNRLVITWRSKELCLLIIVVAACWSLALWQLSRAGDKHQEALLLAAKKQAAAVALDSLSHPADARHQWKKVYVSGRYIDQSILIENTFYQGQRGYEVITPFELSSGEGLLLVSRGWHIDSKPHLPVEQFETTQQLIGEISLPPANAFFLQPVVSDRQWPIALHHFQLSTISALYDRPLLDFVLRLQPAQPGALVAHWGVVTQKSTNHIAYAMQWFAFSIIALMIYLIRNSNAKELLQQSAAIQITDKNKP